jgi:NADPH:quinone reductase-like Zn-dependent oxidoreductase
MDHRQEARARFDRIMRVPDLVADWVSFAACGIALLMAIDVLTGQVSKTGDAYLLIGASVGTVAIYLSYLALRFVAALVITASTIRRGRSMARDAADLHAENPADRQTARPLAAGN